MGKRVQYRSRCVKPFAISSRGRLSSADARTEPIKPWAQSILEEGRASTTLCRVRAASSDNRATMLGTLKNLPPWLELRRRPEIDFSV